MSNVKSTPKSQSLLENKGMRFLALFVATGGGSGYIPIAPGTAGALVGLACVYYVAPLSQFLLIALTLLLSGAGVWAGTAASQIWKTTDPSRVVIDEIVGMMLTMIGIPTAGYYLVVGFLLFRLFDVWKPVPANYFETRFKLGWGIMADDIMAGIYGNIVMHLVVRAQF